MLALAPRSPVTGYLSIFGAEINGTTWELSEGGSWYIRAAGKLRDTNERVPGALLALRRAFDGQLSPESRLLALLVAAGVR